MKKVKSEVELLNDMEKDLIKARREGRFEDVLEYRAGNHWIEAKCFSRRSRA